MCCERLLKEIGFRAIRLYGLSNLLFFTNIMNARDGVNIEIAGAIFRVVPTQVLLYRLAAFELSHST